MKINLLYIVFVSLSLVFCTAKTNTSVNVSGENTAQTDQANNKESEEAQDTSEDTGKAEDLIEPEARIDREQSDSLTISVPEEYEGSQLTFHLKLIDALGKVVHTWNPIVQTVEGVKENNENKKSAEFDLNLDWPPLAGEGFYIDARIVAPDGKETTQTIGPFNMDYEPPIISKFKISDINSLSENHTNDELVRALVLSSSEDVTGFCVKQDETLPLSRNDPCFIPLNEQEVSISGEGVITLFAWAIDAKGNFSDASTASISKSSYDEFVGIAEVDNTFVGSKHLMLHVPAQNDPYKFKSLEVYQSDSSNPDSFNLTRPNFTLNLTGEEIKHIISDLPDGAQRCFLSKAKGEPGGFTYEQKEVVCGKSKTLPEMPDTQPSISDPIWQEIGAYRNHRIDNIVKGEIATILGDQSTDFGKGSFNDYALTENLGWVTGIVEDEDGNIYYIKRRSDCVKKIDALTKKVSTIIGKCGESGKVGLSGTKGTGVRLSQPTAIDYSPLGNLIVHDHGNRRIIEYSLKNKLLVGTYFGEISVHYGDGISVLIDGYPKNSFVGMYPVYDVDYDSFGNIYISDPNTCTIRQVSKTTAIATTIAGAFYIDTSIPHADQTRYCGEGTVVNPTGLPNGTYHKLNTPRAIAVDPANNDLYYFEEGKLKVIRSDSDNEIKPNTAPIHIAGTGEAGYTGDDGPALSAKIDPLLYSPVIVGTNLFFLQSDAHAIRYVNLTAGTIHTLLGGPNIGTGPIKHGESISENAGLHQPWGLGRGLNNSLLVSLRGSGEIIRVDLDSQKIFKVVGNSDVVSRNLVGENPLNVPLARPLAAIKDKDGNLIIADDYNLCVHRLNKDTGKVTTIAGKCGKSVKNPTGNRADEMPIHNIEDIAIDSQDNLYMLDRYGCVIRKVDIKNGTYETIIGAHFVDEDWDCDWESDISGSAKSKKLYYASAIELSLDENYLYYSDNIGDTIRKVGVNGPDKDKIFDVMVNSTVTGVRNYNICSTKEGDIPNVDGCGITDMAIDKDGSIYIGDDAGYLRKIGTDNKVTIIAGNGATNYPTEKVTADPTTVSLDIIGGVYLTEVYIYFSARSLHAVYQIDRKTNEMRLIAGTVQKSGYMGDGGKASDAIINLPNKLVIDDDGNLIISSRRQNKVRAIKLED